MAKIDFILNNLPDLYDKSTDSNLYKLLSSFGTELDTFTDEMDKAKRSRFVDTATGSDLDKLGELINLRRFFNESDDNYRGRLKSKVPSFIGGGAISAIRQVIKNYLGVEPSIIEHYVPGDGHPFFDNGVIADSNIVVDSGLKVKANPGIVYIGGNRIYPEFVTPTLNNLLGADGNCEDTSKYIYAYATVSTDVNHLTMGSKSIKITRTQTTSYMNTVTKIYPQTGDCYVCIADTYLESLAFGNYIASSGSGVGVSSVKNVTSINTDSYSATTIGEFVPIIYALKVSTLAQPGTSFFNLQIANSGLVGESFYVDSFRVYKIPQDEYDSLSENVSLETALKIASKYPYVDNNISNVLTLPPNTTTNVYMNSFGGLFYRDTESSLPNQALLAKVTTNASSITNIVDKRFFLDPYKHYITNTASITIQIPYNFSETSVISLEDTRQILKETKAAGVAFLMSVFGSYEESLSLSDNISFKFQVGFSGMGTANYL
jgi:hypothetical protein